MPTSGSCSHTPSHSRKKGGSGEKKVLAGEGKEGEVETEEQGEV